MLRLNAKIIMSLWIIRRNLFNSVLRVILHSSQPVKISRAKLLPLILVIIPLIIIRLILRQLVVARKQ
jgi:hypothetical protein